jgi:transglutaminase-like putative cysteine protease
VRAGEGVSEGRSAGPGLAFAREKRLLLGALAFLAPLPLPFNEVLEWWWLVGYLVAVGTFCWRAWRDHEQWLPLWAQNLLGGLYLVFFWLDVTALARGQLVRALLHLGLFVVAVKLYAMRREGEKWQVLVIVFFLFLAAMGTSVHPTIALYLLAFLVLALYTLMRFAILHVVAGFGHGDDPLRLPLGRLLAGCTLAAVIGAIPLFVLLPRIREPIVFGGGTGTGTEQASSGFGDDVDLDLTSRLRESREVAARLEYANQPRGELRLRAATYDLFEGARWRRSPRHADGALRRTGPGAYSLDTTVPPMAADTELWSGLPAIEAARRNLGVARPLVRDNNVRIYLQPLGSTSLPVPPQAIAVSGLRNPLQRDRGGALLLPSPPGDAVAYDVDLAEAGFTRTVPEAAWSDAEALDEAGISPQMRELATAVMVGSDALARVRALERHLATSYAYTTDFVGRGGSQPIEDFLFRYKSGHCEYFASAMVLLLRAQGVPARLVTGFYGADRNPLEGYYIVRQANAHAWVEAWVEGQGWMAFDPTPASGRPGLTRTPWDLVTQLSDALVFRWDRYVLSYGIEDQIGLLRALRESWSKLWKAWFGEARQPELPQPPPAEESTPPTERSPEPLANRWVTIVVIVLALLGLGLGWWHWRHRPRFNATRAYLELRRAAARRVGVLPSSVPPLAFAARVAGAEPTVAEPVARLVERYLRESFGADPLQAPERVALERDLVTAVRALRKRRPAA